MCCLRSTKQRGTLTEYLSTFFGLELFPCPKRFTPPRAVLRGKQMGFGHPVAKNDSNIQRTRGGVRCAGEFSRGNRHLTHLATSLQCGFSERGPNTKSLGSPTCVV